MNFFQYRYKVGQVLLIVNALFALYTAGFGLLSALDQRGLHWLFLSSSLFLLYKPSTKGGMWYNHVRELWVTLLTVGAVSSSLYLLFVWEQRTQTSNTGLWDTFMAVTMVIVVIEATRRAVGKFLMFITLAFIVYALFGPYFPEPLNHRGQSLERLSDFLYMSTEGIYGLPMGISATFIIVFVLFGAFLERFGGGKWFIDMAYALTGRFRGGPAKTAVFASGLMGMLSGSPVANAVTTGTFTIPLMKNVGFKSHQAGAIEAVASTGGMITPPIMGAGAFIMADYLGMPYQQIALVAIMPAILFYISLLLRIDSISVKQKLIGMPKNQLPKLSEVIKKRGHLSIPLIFLIIMIVVGRSPLYSAFWAIIIAFFIALIQKTTRPSLKTILEAFENGSKGVITIATACASAGIIVGVMSVTGLGATISYALFDLSQGNVIVALVLCMIITIILGFGMPPTAVYIILVAILVRPLTDMGVQPLAAHMFIFYYSTLGALTPPVAITAYAAAAISKSNPNKTGLTAFHMGALAYIIPFIFVFSPSLLLQGSMVEITIAILTALVGVSCWVAGIEGYLFRSWSWFSRILLISSALLLLYSGVTTDIVAIFIIVGVFIIEKLLDGKKKQQNCQVINYN